jgi:predicted ATP-binding protein involved in virulence
MTARTIGKLRKIIASYKEFTVKPTIGCFGLLSVNNNKTVFTCKAKDELHAIRKYLKYFSNHHKECYKLTDIKFIEATKRFSKFKVIDEKGFEKYYN